MLTILILEQSQSTQNFRGFSISDTQVFAHLAQAKFYMKGRTLPLKKRKRKREQQEQQKKKNTQNLFWVRPRTQPLESN